MGDTPIVNTSTDTGRRYLILPPNNLKDDLWEKAKECKRKFLEEGYNPKLSPYIPLEVAESWVLAKNNRVNPYVAKFEHNLSKQKFNYILKIKKDLIEIVLNYLEKVHSILCYSNFIMLLLDEHGVVLLMEGSKKELEAFKRINIQPSAVLSEQLVGTTAHNLCLRYRKPVQIIGPYNYCLVLQDNISSATPIFDEDGRITGILVVVQMIARKDLPDIDSHSLGWVMSMGYAIENMMRLKNQNHELTVLNETLDTALALADEGIIAVNSDGYITHSNKEGSKILGAGLEEIVGKHLSSFMDEKYYDVIMNSISKGESLQDYEVALTNNKRITQCMINLKPITGGQGANLKSAIIRLSLAEKINRMVTHRGGTAAHFRFEDIIGESTAIKKAIKLARKIASTEVNVLLIGESGTGKELFAQSIHNAYRPNGPFIAVNCASLPRNLIESELFGYEGGAFTGADRKGRPGKIELANGGTLFLDEIGDMPLEIQPVLLRVLEEKRVMRIGGSHYIPVDFRVIAATNKNLLDMVRKNTFREDLYFRLATFKIEIPPLRERENDAVLLAEHFIKDIARKFDCEVPRLSPEVYKRIKEYDWPGNVRQLQNAMVYSVNMSVNGMIQLRDLPDELTKRHNRQKVNANQMTLKELERNAILEALEQTDYDTSEVARILGIGRTTIYRKLKEYGIDIPKNKLT